MDYKIRINPNTNTIINKINNKTYKMYSGDYKKTNRIKQYYTPCGTCQVLEKKKDNSLMYFPFFIRLSFFKLPCVYNENVSNYPYGIHGYGRGSHRKRVSIKGNKFNGYITRGCITLNDADLKELYNTIKVGDYVYVEQYNNKKLQNYMKKFSRHKKLNSI